MYYCFSEILDSLRPVSPEAPASSSAPQRFLKINVRHITDGQVCECILLHLQKKSNALQYSLGL